MGAKKLKGLVVTGDREVIIFDKKKFDTVKKEITLKLNTEWKKWADKWRRYETCADLNITNELGIIPTRNWQGGQFEGWRETLAIRSDHELMAEIEKGVRSLKTKPALYTLDELFR